MSIFVAKSQFWKIIDIHDSAHIYSINIFLKFTELLFYDKDL